MRPDRERRGSTAEEAYLVSFMTLKFPSAVEIVEVGPRDGLQHLDHEVSVDEKLRMIALLVKAGIRTIEATAFVRPDVMPQMADAGEVIRGLPRDEGVNYRALVPNLKGAERAIEAGVDELLGLTTTSDTYNKLNSNMTVEQNITMLEEVASLADQEQVPLTVAIGLAFFCPYEGDIPPDRVLRMIDILEAAGVRKLYLATSVGMDGPREVHDLCGLVRQRFSGISLGLHLHNTNGMALANALGAMDAGVSWFEGSICGIGGGIVMPPGTPDVGNVATEDLVAMFASANVETGIDLEQLRSCALEIAGLLQVPPQSSLLQAGTKSEVLEFGRKALHDA